MNRRFYYLLFVVLLVTGAVADRLMDPNETESLLTQLTETPRQYWLSQGMIQAQHLEYYGYENKIRQASETIYHDGSRVRMDVILADEQSTEATLAGSAAHQINQDFKLNKSRIFIWDGQKHVQYYKSADYAIVSMNQQTTPDLCGPLTAGIVPWGHGDFSYLVLMSHSPKVHEQYSNGQQHYVLTYTNTATMPEMNVTFVLDPSKANAVLSYSIENDLALLRQTYEDYLLVDGQWVPSKVLIERFDKRSGTPKLLSYEDWQFDVIDAVTPAEELFSIQYKNGTTVELHPASGIKTFLYEASDRIDTSTVLADKIGLLSENQKSVNCATAAIEHVGKRFSKELNLRDMTGMISEDTQKTSLYDMKKTFEGAGLECMAVTTDLETLGKIDNCAIILHLGISNHYVIVDHFDPDGAWIIDLTNRQFIFKQKIDTLMQEWNSGTALLVSDAPITPPLDSTFQYLEADEMTHILGGDFGSYSCTDLLQTEEQIMCSDPIGNIICYGAYYAFSERYGCEQNDDGGTCVGKKMVAYVYTPCSNKTTSQSGICTHTADSTSRFMRACK